MVTFQPGQKYHNNIGEYEVIHIQGDSMRVRYLNGKQQILSIAIQSRIYENRNSKALLGNTKSFKASSYNNTQQYWTMGFLLARLTFLGANITKDKESEFQIRYFDATSKELNQNQTGISYLRNGANQWGNQGIIRFTATHNDLPLLIFSSSNNIPFPTKLDDIYEVKDIRYLFFLLEHKFQLGSKQDKETIINNMPEVYKDSFLKGYYYAQGVLP